MDIKREIMESIDILLSKRMERTTQVFYGMVISVGQNQCVVKINGKEYTLAFYGGTPTANHKYPVVVPQGNFSQAFIIG